MTTPPPHLSSTGPLFALGLTLLACGVGAWWFFGDHSLPCDPPASAARLSTYQHRGIQRVHHPPSLSNLLWVTVGPEWHALSDTEKHVIDKEVRCAATIIDDLGQVTWQAAYYDAESGKLVALTSKKYGFRIQAQPDL